MCWVEKSINLPVRLGAELSEGRRGTSLGRDTAAQITGAEEVRTVMAEPAARRHVTSGGGGLTAKHKGTNY